MVIEIVGYDEWRHRFFLQWLNLFRTCFRVPAYSKKADLVSEKYALHSENSRFALLCIGDRLVASYSGICLKFDSFKLFLSVDTMSNGEVRHSTVLLANAFYPFLQDEGIAAVIGYPNDRIIGLREKYLNWTFCGKLCTYLSLPGLDTFYKKFESSSPVWSLARTKRVWWGESKRFCRLRSGVGVSPGSSILPIVTMSSVKPGPLYLKIPSFLGFDKRFGYRILISNQFATDLEDKLRLAAGKMSLECIDIP